MQFNDDTTIADCYMLVEHMFRGGSVHLSFKRRVVCVSSFFYVEFLIEMVWCYTWLTLCHITIWFVYVLTFANSGVVEDEQKHNFHILFLLIDLFMWF